MGLAKSLQLKTGAKFISTANLDIQDRLINDQTRNICRIEFFIRFSDEQIGLKTMRWCHEGRKNYWVPIEKCEPEVSVKKRWASPSIKSTQFPILAWTSTVNKAQDLIV